MYAMVLEFEFVLPGQQARVITYIYNPCMPHDVNKAGCLQVSFLSAMVLDVCIRHVHGGIVQA